MWVQPGARKRKKMTAAEVISAGAATQRTSEQCFAQMETQLAAMKGDFLFKAGLLERGKGGYSV